MECQSGSAHRAPALASVFELNALGWAWGDEMGTRVFIDGEAGTTGLHIRERLAARDDISLVSIPTELRKDTRARAEAYGAADVAILCLPDAAAVEAVGLAGDTRLIDASTAHRVDPGWVYGMPELPGAAQAIAQASRVANVGCYATGSIALVRPLRDAGILNEDARVILTGVSGYSGGGKALIAEFEPAKTAPDHFLYANDQAHKHVPEIMAHGRLSKQPLFQPSVGNFLQGMVVQLHLTPEQLDPEIDAASLHDILQAFYADAIFVDVVATQARVAATALNGTNRMQIAVHGNPNERVFTLTATLDNLGKGASGTAVQNLNLMIGADAWAGLDSGV